MEATKRAFKGMGNFASGMNGGICVADRSGNVYSYEATAESHYVGSGPHIEWELFAAIMLKHFDADLKKIPNNSTVVWCCEWSPCALCGRDKQGNTHGIDAIVRSVNNATDRNVRFKFRFMAYYKKPNAPHNPKSPSDFRFADQAAADLRYGQLVSSFGTVQTIGKSGPKQRPMLSIAPLGDTTAASLRELLREEAAAEEDAAFASFLEQIEADGTLAKLDEEAAKRFKSK